MRARTKEMRQTTAESGRVDIDARHGVDIDARHGVDIVTRHGVDIDARLGH